MDKEEIRKEVKKQSRTRRGNTQGCGCLLILASIALAFTLVGLPFAGIVFLVGLIVLIVGFFI